MPEFALPYDVLIVDDQIDVSGHEMSWSEQVKQRLEEHEFRAVHVTSPGEARQAISRMSFDIIIIDLDLQSPQTGDELLIELHNTGLRQPAILVSGKVEFLDRRIGDYAHVLSLGPVSFFDKRPGNPIDFLDLVRRVSNRVDPIRRVLRLMKDAGLGDREFRANDRTYTVEELLAQSLTNDDLIRTLRESLYQLVLEWQMSVREAVR
jgi:DNA-binding NtrC family response regulator